MRDVAHIHADFSPHNVEAEQQLLGAFLVSPDILNRTLSDAIRSGGNDLFHDPVHQRIFAAIRAKDKLGHLVSPVTIRDMMASDAGLDDLGGPRYLVRIAGASIGAASVPDYIRLLADLKRKRELIAGMNAAQAAIAKGEESAHAIASRLEASLMSVDGVGDHRPVSMLSASTDALEAAYKAYHGEESNGISSGIGSLDKIVPGFYPGELILLGGRPSMGKTAVALSFAMNAARAGKGVCIASLEMTPDAMAMRAISEQTSEDGGAVAYSKIRTGDMTEPEFRAVVAAQKRVGELPVHFLPSSYRDIAALVSGVKQVQAKMGGRLRLVIVDYLQLLRGSGRGRYEEITEISIALKGMALQLGLPVIALSQLSRAVEQREDKRPQMSDLRESGQLEQDADTILFCYRGEYYLEREKPDERDLDEAHAWNEAMARVKGELEVIVAKQRQGEIGTAKMKFNPATNTIWDDAWRHGGD